MVRSARYAYAALAWAFVAGILLQVYFIGLGLFAGPETWIHVALIVVIVLALSFSGSPNA